MKKHLLLWVTLIGLCPFPLEAKNRFYVVKPGDSLGSIALHQYGNKKKWTIIAHDNHLKPPYSVTPGQKLKLKVTALALRKGHPAVAKLKKPPAKARKPIADPIDALSEEKNEVAVISTLSPDRTPAESDPLEQLTKEIPNDNTVEVIEESEPSQPIGVGTAIGITTVNYRQTNLSDFSELGLTAKLGYQHGFFLENLTIEADAYGTVFAFNANQNNTIRFLGINGRLGYRLPFIGSPWTVKLKAGVFYCTTFVTNNAFGYKNLVSPEIILRLEREIYEGGNVAGIYAKFAPLGTGFFNSDFSQREIAVGLSYQFLLSNHHALSFAADFSDIRFSPAIAARITSTTFTFGIGYGL